SIDRVLQYFIRNLPDPPSLLIEIYLRKAGFWHMANIGQRCKLDLKLISAFVERWRPETHTLHLPCGECTITLEDMQLQLRLPVDGSILTKFVQSADRTKSTIRLGVHPLDHQRLSDAGQVMKPSTFQVAVETHRF
ncbi:hypothetical protein Gotri_004348, partial [Gossypium trilobum]|nr:hypothetical protein [Gossypium trilobum]